MRVLVTGHHGYIGSVLTPLLQSAGHEVVGIDADWYADCLLGPAPAGVPSLRMDVRDVTAAQLKGIDAVIHLAAISNDPLGDMNPDCTYEINFHASVRLARLARDAGVERFLFASSCSLYGASDIRDVLGETAPFNPVTPYGESKVMVEWMTSKLASDTFSPVFLRSATVYGFSPRLRADLVVNNLVGYACTRGEVLLKSDGSPWRPLVHVEDLCRAYLALLEAPRDLVHRQAFNVGRTGENYQVRQVAELVRELVPGSEVRLGDHAEPDLRCYRITCEKIEQRIPGFQPRWTVRTGIEQLRDAYRAERLTEAEFLSSRYTRLKEVKRLQDAGRLDPDLRWLGPDREVRSQ